MLDAKLKVMKKHGEENVKHKPAIEDLRRLKESGPHKPTSKSKSSKGNQQQLQQSGSASCAMIPKQQNFTSTTSDSTSQPCSRAAKSGKFTSLSRAIKQNVIHVELKLMPRL